MFHLLFLLMQIRHGCILVSAVTVTSSFDALSFPSVASHHPCSSSSTFIYQLTLSSTSSHALDVWRRWVAFWKAESELLRFVVLPWSNIDLLSIDPVKNGVTFCFLLSSANKLHHYSWNPESTSREFDNNLLDHHSNRLLKLHRLIRYYH